MLVSRFLFLMVFGFEYGCPGFESWSFWKRRIAKINFRRSRKFHDSRIHYSWFWVALGFIFMWILASLVPKPTIWHAWLLQFGALGDPGPILGHWGEQERTLGGPGLIFLLIVGRFRDPILTIFLGALDGKLCLFMLVSRSLILVICKSEPGCLGMEKQTFGKTHISFRRNCFSLVNFATYPLAPIVRATTLRVTMCNPLPFNHVSYVPSS